MNSLISSKENMNTESSKGIEDLFKLFSASVDLQRQTLEKINAIDERLKLVENRQLEATATPPAPPQSKESAVDPLLLLQLQKQIVGCIQSIDARLKKLDESAVHSKTPETPKPTPTPTPTPTPIPAAADKPTVTTEDDQDSLSSLQEEMLSWMFNSCDDQSGSQGDLTDLQKNMVQWLLNSNSIRRATKSYQKLPEEFEREALCFSEENQSCPSSKSASNSNNLNQITSRKLENENLILGDETDTDSNMSDNLDGNNSELVVKKRDIANVHALAKEATGESSVSTIAILRTIVAILLKETLERDVQINEQAVLDEVSKLRKIGSRVYRKMIKSLARHSFEGSLQKASAVKWSGVPLEIKKKYSLLLEKKSLKKINLNIGRCESMWAANAVLSYTTSKKNIKGIDQNKDCPVIERILMLFKRVNVSAGKVKDIFLGSIIYGNTNHARKYNIEQ